MTNEANLYNQFQSDVTSVANNMMTQLVCAEKGIDYNLLMQTAQQAHLQGIVQQEQTRAMEQALKRHYQGNQPQGIIGRIKEAISPEPASNPFMNPFMPAMPQMGMNPMAAMAPMNPVAPMSQMNAMNPMAAMNPMPNPSFQQGTTFPSPEQLANQLATPQPANEPIVPVGNDVNRVAMLEQEMAQLKEMIMSLGQVMQPMQSVQPSNQD